MTHWRTFYPSKYLGSEDLHDAGLQELTVLIEKVQLEIITGPDNRKDNKGVMYIKGLKPMIVNVTNCKMIAKVLGTSEVEEWANKSVTLYVEKVKAFGEVTDALRVRPSAPVPDVLPTLNEQHLRWAGAKTSISTGATTIEQIKAHFTLSAEDEAKLQAPVPAVVTQPAAPVPTPAPELSVAPIQPLPVVNGQTTATAEAEAQANPVGIPITDGTLPTLNEAHEKWAGVRGALLKKLTSIETIQKQYFISAEDVLKLTAPALPGE